MPELPEVERVRRECEAEILGKTFRAVDASDSRSVLVGKTPSAFERALLGRTIEKIGRRGKYFWWSLQGGGAVLLHLGMTGWVEFCAKGDELPKYARLVFEMNDDTCVAFTDPRRFGKIRLLKGDPESELPVKRLGVDPLDEVPSPAALQKVFQKRRVSLKALLLDQTVFAGVGNWIADEVLYQAELRPARLCPTLSIDEIRALRATLLKVLRTAVRHQANSDDFPKQWLFHHRWGKKKDAQTARGEKIRHDTIAGRTTAWVPTRQR